VLPNLFKIYIILNNIKIEPNNVYNAIKKLARALRSREPPRNIIKKIGTRVASKK